MKGFHYQLINIRRDKLCILSFLLPVLAGVAINLFSGVSFRAIYENTFYIVKNELSSDCVMWLERYGSVTAFEDVNLVRNAVNDPATQGIGVLQNNNGISTLLSGDELQMNRVIGNTLPQLFAERGSVTSSNISFIPSADSRDGIKSLLIVIIMITAMFMGCTYNAMSIIGEKEDGIALLNKILPMTKYDFFIQKIIIGLTGAIISAGLTAGICMRVAINQISPLTLMIILSAFIAALIGLFIGHFSDGLMVGIVYIKVTMILFIAPPILFYLTVPAGSLLHTLSYLLPSSAAFYGLMDLLNGQVEQFGINILILSAHCVIWLLLFFAMERRGKNRLLH